MTDPQKPTAADLSNLVQQIRDAITERRHALAELGQLTGPIAEDLDREVAEAEVLREIGCRTIEGTMSAGEAVLLRKQIAQIAASDGLRGMPRPTLLN